MSTNGQAEPTPSEPPALLVSIQAAYDEARQRDTSLERRLFHAHIREVVLVGLCALLIVVVLWEFLSRRNIQAFVQVVQVDEQGAVHPLGIPQHLLTYTPEDAHWQDMLAQWVKLAYWRGTDVPQAEMHLNWVKMHTCGAAVKSLALWEKEEKPLELGKRTSQVTIKAVHQTQARHTYQVVWEEVMIEGSQQPVTKQYSATFTVARVQPKKEAVMLENRLGLCVNGFSRKEAI